MEEQLIDVLTRLVDQLAELVLSGEELYEAKEATRRSRDFLFQQLADRKEYAGITYWHHAESDCVIQAFGPYEAEQIAQAGADQITRERYLQFETEDLI